MTKSISFVSSASRHVRAQVTEKMLVDLAVLLFSTLILPLTWEPIVVQRMSKGLRGPKWVLPFIGTLAPILNPYEFIVAGPQREERDLWWSYFMGKLDIRGREPHEEIFLFQVHSLYQGHLIVRADVAELSKCESSMASLAESGDEADISSCEFKNLFIY